MLSAILAASASQALAQGWRPVTGAAIYTLFAGKEFGDGVHFAYRLGKDRSFAGTEMGKEVRGKWRVEANQMCWTWIDSTNEEECYDVQRDGRNVRLFRNGVEAWGGRISP